MKAFKYVENLNFTTWQEILKMLCQNLIFEKNLNS